MNGILTTANVVITLDYLLIGLFFLQRLLATRQLRRTHRWAVFGLASMALFFFGCMHTHLDIALQHTYHGHQASWLYVVSHVLQAVGGLAFYWLARRKLVINIYDRETYERATDAETERRLDYLAARVGLTSR